METSTILAIIIGGFIALCYGIKKYLGRNQDYWIKRGVPQVKGSYESGLMNMYYLLTKKKNILDFDVDRYFQCKGPFGGVVDMGTPALVVKDPELIKHILVKDFDHFVDRRKMQLESEKALQLMLSALEGQEWKNVRATMSPTFTTGKIRRMFGNFNKVGAQLVKFIRSRPVGSPGTRDVLVKEAMSRYLVDVIGATAFGMETNSLQDPNSMFYKMANKTSQFSMLKLMKIIVMMAFPWLTKLGLRFTDDEAMSFFEDILKKALKNREASGEKRDDFLQLMIETRKGELQTDESELDAFEKDAQIKPGPGGRTKVNMSDEMILAQSLLFFLAGIDTTGSVLCFAFYLLALHPDIQQKLYDEVSEVMDAKGGDVDYDGILRMEYLDKFVSEILRKYPPGVRLERRVTKPYTIPGTSVTLEKDTLVYFPVWAMHLDPNHYPEPEKFDPERFTPEEKAARNPYTYLPFGQGPRNCIGMRFALMEAKVAIAYVVYNFFIEPTETTPVPIKLDTSFASRPTVDLELRFKERKNLLEE